MTPDVPTDLRSDSTIDEVIGAATTATRPTAHRRTYSGSDSESDSSYSLDEEERLPKMTQKSFDDERAKMRAAASIDYAARYARLADPSADAGQVKSKKKKTLHRRFPSLNIFKSKK